MLLNPTPVYTLEYTRREALSIEKGEYLLPYDMRLTEAMGLLRYNPAKMVVAFTAYYREELKRKVGYSSTGGIRILIASRFCIDILAGCILM